MGETLGLVIAAILVAGLILHDLHKLPAFDFELARELAKGQFVVKRHYVPPVGRGWQFTSDHGLSLRYYYQLAGTHMIETVELRLRDHTGQLVVRFENSDIVAWSLHGRQCRLPRSCHESFRMHAILVLVRDLSDQAQADEHARLVYYRS